MTEDLGAVLPDLHDPQAGPFWRAAHQGELRMQRCEDCGELRWTPQDTCPHCLSRSYTWDRLSGRGRIYSYCVYHRVLNAAFTDVPYTVVMVTLDEGPVIIGRLLDDAREPAIDDRVESVFTPVSTEMSLVNFQLAPESVTA
jgi:uncharacterized OB-fold protein